MEDEENIENEFFLVTFYRNNKVLIFILLIIVAFIIIMKFAVGNNSNNDGNTNNQIVIEPITNSTIAVGNTITLKATTNDNNVIIYWTSSDINIAMVDNGIVKGVKPGKVKIIASYIDNNDTKYSSEAIDITVIEGDSGVTINSINFPKGSLYMPINDEYHLSLIVDPTNAKINEKMFISTNERVATVSNDGVVKAKNAGHAIIVATVDNKYKASIDLFVGDEYSKSEIVISPTTISFDIGSRKIKIGDSERLSYNITPSDADKSKIKWTSSDSSVVTVDQNGLIKGIKEGVATVSISSINGKRDDITIEVYNNIIAVTDIVLTSDTINMETGKTMEITPVVLPENASNKELSYSSSNPSIVSVAVNNSGAKATLSALQNGSAIITIKSGNIEKKITVNVTGDSQIDDETNLPTTIKVKSNRNNLAKTYEEAKTMPVPGAATVTITLSTGVGKIKYCINKYGEIPCTPNIEKYSNTDVLIPSSSIYVLRVIKYDYRDNEIPGVNNNYINGVLHYYINTLSNEQTKLYTVTNTYNNATTAVLNPSKIGDTITVKLDDIGRYLDICATTNTTCTPNIRVTSSQTISLDKIGTWRVFVIEYDKNGRKVGNTEVYYAYVPNNSPNALVKASNFKIDSDSNGKYLSIDVESDLTFTMTRFCYTVVNKDQMGTCNLDLLSNSVLSGYNNLIMKPEEILKTYYAIVDSTNKKTFNFYISELDSIYQNSKTNQDVIFEFAVKSSNGYSSPIRLRINMNSRSGNTSKWSVIEVK